MSRFAVAVMATVLWIGGLKAADPYRHPIRDAIAKFREARSLSREEVQTPVPPSIPKSTACPCADAPAPATVTVPQQMPRPPPQPATTGYTLYTDRLGRQYLVPDSCPNGKCGSPPR